MAHVDDRSNWRPEHIQMTQGHDEGRRHLLAQKYIYLSPISKITVHNFLINTTIKENQTNLKMSQTHNFKKAFSTRLHVNVSASVKILNWLVQVLNILVESQTDNGKENTSNVDADSRQKKSSHATCMYFNKWRFRQVNCNKLFSAAFLWM